MHEAIISRGVVRMCSDEVKLMIHTKENCVLVHPGCHIKTEFAKGKLQCAMQLIMFEGYSNIMAWLKTMEDAGIGVMEERLFVKEALYTMMGKETEKREPMKVWRFLE